MATTNKKIGVKIHIDELLFGDLELIEAFQSKRKNEDGTLTYQFSSVIEFLDRVVEVDIEGGIRKVPVVMYQELMSAVEKAMHDQTNPLLESTQGQAPN